jgi:hypothetical protein
LKGVDLGPLGGRSRGFKVLDASRQILCNGAAFTDLGMHVWRIRAPDAVRDLARSFAEHRYELRGNSVGIEVAGAFVEVTGIPGQSPSEVLIELAGVIEERGYGESDFLEPDWNRLRARRAGDTARTSKN